MRRACPVARSRSTLLPPRVVQRHDRQSPPWSSCSIPAGGASDDPYEAAAAGSDDGRAVSVVVDACGSFYVGLDKLDQVAPPGAPIRAYVVTYARVP